MKTIATPFVDLESALTRIVAMGNILVSLGEVPENSELDRDSLSQLGFVIIEAGREAEASADVIRQERRSA